MFGPFRGKRPWSIVPVPSTIDRQLTHCDVCRLRQQLKDPGSITPIQQSTSLGQSNLDGSVPVVNLFRPTAKFVDHDLQLLSILHTSNFYARLTESCIIIDLLNEWRVGDSTMVNNQPQKSEDISNLGF